jgi:hypothetical protein
MFVVPKGVQRKPYAENEVKLLLIEPRGVLNTGDAGGERTAGRPQPIRVNQRNRLASEVGSSKPVTSNLSTRHHRPEITVPVAFQPSL